MNGKRNLGHMSYKFAGTILCANWVNYVDVFKKEKYVGMEL